MVSRGWAGMLDDDQWVKPTEADSWNKIRCSITLIWTMTSTTQNTRNKWPLIVIKGHLWYYRMISKGPTLRRCNVIWAWVANPSLVTSLYSKGFRGLLSCIFKNHGQLNKCTELKALHCKISVVFVFTHLHKFQPSHNFASLFIDNNVISRSRLTETRLRTTQVGQLF